MSWEATDWAVKQRTGSPIDKLNLLLLANRADQDGVCWPSQARLAVEGEQSDDTVQRSLARLENAGLICRNRCRKTRGRQGYIYQLLMPHVAENTAQSGLVEKAQEKQSRKAALSGVPPNASTPQKAALLGRRERRNKAAQSGVEPSLESSNEFAGAKTRRRPGAVATGAIQPMPEAVVACLRKKLGGDTCRAWFAKIEVVGDGGDAVTMRAPTRFIADHIIAQFDGALLEAWRAVRPALQRVHVVGAQAGRTG